jgi:hypothetical protein
MLKLYFPLTPSTPPEREFGHPCLLNEMNLNLYISLQVKMKRKVIRVT